MRNSILTINDTGTIVQERIIAAGEEQSMVLIEENLPPIFGPGVLKYDVLK